MNARGAAADIGALSATVFYAVWTYISDHPGDSILWFLAFLLAVVRLPTAWLDLRDRWRRRKRP